GRVGQPIAAERTAARAQGCYFRVRGRIVAGDRTVGACRDDGRLAHQHRANGNLPARLRRRRTLERNAHEVDISGIHGLTTLQSDCGWLACGGSGACSFAGSSGRNRAGSTNVALSATPQCRCGPVARPVAPTLPRVAPALTRCPGLPAMALRWQYIVIRPAP